MEVPVRDLKENLSAVIRRVRGGEEVIVTSHRKPVAKLVPLRPEAPAAGTVVDRMIAAGLVSCRPEPGLWSRPTPNPAPAGAGLLSDAVIEDRG